MTGTGADRRSLLDRARLYLVCDAHPNGRDLGGFLTGCLGAGVDVVQLRDKLADDRALLDAGKVVRSVSATHNALFILNDRVDLVAALEADGVHIGQQDMPVARARELLGADRLIGLSTHTSAQVDDADGVDYLGVGPVFQTPTKAGRPAVGTALVRYATANARVPFFAIGGIDPTTVGSVVAAGAQRVAVVRALTEADDPASVARSLCAATSAASAGDHREAGVGAT
ncbi:MAG: thiamine phosphate synthase [Solirubrobacteraceae bacterium]